MSEALAAALESLLARSLPGDDAVPGEVNECSLRRLTGGANMQTWAFDYERSGKTQALILRRRPPGMAAVQAFAQGIDLAQEHQLLSLAKRAGVAVPSLVAAQQANAGSDASRTLGECLVMTRVRGEALPQKLQRDPQYADARTRFAFECGEALGRIHAIALDDLPSGLRDLAWEADLRRLQSLCDEFGNVSPAHQLALNWLCEQEAPASPRVLCHGDFRLGNLMLNERGLAAVLDWELAHIGHAGEDLGYLCANVWRFGGEKPVAGIDDYRPLLDGYRSVRDAAPDLRELMLWQLYAALGWGLVCLTMQALHDSGADPGVERAAVGRRLCESEIDVLLLLEALERDEY